MKKASNIDPISHNTEKGMEAYWANNDNRKRWLASDYVAIYHKLIALLEQKNILNDNKTWADVGCGSGSLLHFLSSKYPNSKGTGYEFSASAIEISQKRLPSYTFHKHDIYQPVSEKYDMVFCTEVLEHLLYPSKALANITQMLETGGTVVLTVPNGRKDTFDGHINFWSPESWKVFIEQNSNNLQITVGEIEGHALYAIMSR